MALDVKTRSANKLIFSLLSVTTGTSFCGIIGNERRCEYTLIADCVNLAARYVNKSSPVNLHSLAFSLNLPLIRRLMGKAGEGAVMCDAKTKTLCERVSTRNARLSFKGPDMIKVKGKSKKIEVFKVFPKKNVSLADAHKMMHQKGQVRAHPFRGRAPMLKRFTREVEKFQGNKKGLTVQVLGLLQGLAASSSKFRCITDPISTRQGLGRSRGCWKDQNGGRNLVRFGCNAFSFSFYATSPPLMYLSSPGFGLLTGTRQRESTCNGLCSLEMPLRLPTSNRSSRRLASVRCKCIVLFYVCMRCCQQRS